MIKIKDLSFSYTNKSELLLDKIALDIPTGIYLSILGENGSCKSTFIKLVLGLLKPTGGSIELDFNKISYVPQRMDNFNSQFPITVKELLSIHSKTIGIKNPNEINEVLKKVNMVDFQNSLIGNLSGGQQQRVFIAKALIGNPDLIILDEPSTGVDEKSQNEIYPILKNLNENLNKTIISVEHNTDIALKYSTHILRVDKGLLTLYTKKEFINYLECEHHKSCAM